jgi:hypothetical protein
MRPVAELEGDAANAASVESCEWVELLLYGWRGRTGRWTRIHPRRLAASSAMITPPLAGPGSSMS